MAEELKNSEPTGDAGYPDTGPADAQTTDPGPQQSGDGQSGEATIPPEPPTEDTFFNPADIADKPELMTAYKQMQKSYTQGRQEIADAKHKIEAYDAFYANPIDQVQRIAQQYGYQLTRAEAAQVADATGQPAAATPDDWQPQNWNDVMTRATEMAEQNIMQKMNPVFSEVQTMRKQSIESALTEIDPTWQQYEEGMKQNLQVHPTLSGDPAMLYRLSVPQEVLESRATQAALKKLETRQQSANVSGTSTTHRSPTGGLPDKPVSFQEAVAAAKQSLAEQGIRPG